MYCCTHCLLLERCDGLEPLEQREKREGGVGEGGGEGGFTQGWKE